MTITAEPTVEEYLKAHRLALRPRRWLAVVGLVLIALFIVVIVLIIKEWVTRGRIDSTGLTVLAGIVIFLVSWFVVRPLQLKRQFNQVKGPRTATIEIRPDSLLFTSERGQLTQPLAELHKWKANADLILIYHQATIYSIISRRWFASEADFAQFRSYLEAALGPQKA